MKFGFTTEERKGNLTHFKEYGLLRALTNLLRGLEVFRGLRLCFLELLAGIRGTLTDGGAVGSSRGDMCVSEEERMHQRV